MQPGYEVVSCPHPFRKNREGFSERGVGTRLGTRLGMRRADSMLWLLLPENDVQKFFTSSDFLSSQFNCSLLIV